MSEPSRSLKPYLLYCDDSGGPEDELRSVAAVSGPAALMLTLERELRKVLRHFEVGELKWAELRTREHKLWAAEVFLQMCAAALGAGAVRVDILLFEPGRLSRAALGRRDADRLRPLYALAWRQAAEAWGPGKWEIFPDQRTGMRWQDWPEGWMKAFGHGGAVLGGVKEARSERSACIQLADLLAGLARRQPKARYRVGEPGALAWANRQGLLHEFMDACEERGLKLGFRQMALYARHPRLSVRLLSRLPGAL